MTFIWTLGPRARRVAVVAGAALLVVLAIAPLAQASGSRGSFDRKFMREMIGHHAMAVEMAEMAVEKSTHPELKRVSEGIVRSQSAEIKRMQRWLTRWYGVKAPSHDMSEHDMKDMEELEQSTGPAFELRFMSLMTVHHTLAVERAGIAARRARHPQLRRLARQMVTAQEREIDQFREWTVEWYAG